MLERLRLKKLKPIRIKMFITDNEFYWSERVLKNKEIFEEKRFKRSIAGKIDTQSYHHYP